MDPAGRRLIGGGAALLAFLAALTATVVAGLPLGPDIAVARAVQAVGWGPLVPVFAVTDHLDGLRQVALGAGVVAAVFVLWRRLVPAALGCALSAAAYTALELAVRRPRPPADLVHVVRHPAGFSYPSGHAVFYLWALSVLVIALRHRWPWATAPATAVAAILYLAVLIGRVDAGEHWPSDCVGGVLLGSGWTLVVLGLVRQRDGHRLALREAVQHPLDGELAPDP